MAERSSLIEEEKVAEVVQPRSNGLSYEPKPYYEAEQGDHTHLDIMQLVETDPKKIEKAQFFACAICAMVVKEPTECRSCQSLFCSACIQPWRAKNRSCPKKCKGNEDVEFGAVHRFVAQELNDMAFKCRNEHCKLSHKYSEAIFHLSNCELLLQPCSLGCGLGILGADMEYHTQNDCHNVEVICDKCD